MKVYHGSWVEVSKPDLKHSRPDVDFGRGFYTTSIKDQAVKWCGRFKRRGKSGIISCYEFDESASYKLKIRNFESLIDKKEAINRLRYEKPNIQICFRTEEALRLLHYEGSVKV